MLKVITSVADFLKIRNSEEFKTKKNGFVPTMGALHEGHLSLVRKSVSENDITIVSIFVNPTQFNNKSDLENYPSSFEQDIKLLTEAKADYVIFPTYDDIYSDGYTFRINEIELSNKLCGASRPGHFEGVLTIVMKLLNIVRADNAYFGEKDYQQYLLIKGMAEAFYLKTNIVGCPLIREESGLAMSSRNRRLNENELKLAPKFYEILSSGKSDDEIKEELNQSGFLVDYVETINDRKFGAVFLGDIRLIDNVKI